MPPTTAEWQKQTATRRFSLSLVGASNKPPTFKEQLRMAVTAEKERTAAEKAKEEPPAFRFFPLSECFAADHDPKNEEDGFGGGQQATEKMRERTRRKQRLLAIAQGKAMVDDKKEAEKDVHRGNLLAHTLYPHPRTLLEFAALTIQRIYRGTALRRVARRMIRERQHAAAMIINLAIRRFLVKRHVQKRRKWWKKMFSAFRIRRKKR